MIIIKTFIIATFTIIIVIHCSCYFHIAIVIVVTIIFTIIITIISIITIITVFIITVSFNK